MPNLMTPTRRTGRLGALLAGALLATALAGPGPARPAEAAPAPAAAPVVPAASVGGTATGAHRPGLTEAGLVSVAALGEARLWLGLADRRDARARFDVRVELLNDGEPVATGLARCVGGLRAGSAGTAREVTVPWGRITAPDVRPGDVLSLRVSARAGTGTGGDRCGGPPPTGGVRLYHDGKRRPSSFALTLAPDPSTTLYLHSDRASCHRGTPPRDASLSERAPRRGSSDCRESDGARPGDGAAWKPIGTWSLPEQCDCAAAPHPETVGKPPAPDPEPIEITELPLPPVAPADEPGACTTEVNPHGTGCLSRDGNFQAGGFLPDGRHIVADVTFAGAPAAPDPRSVYAGSQLIVLKTDGTTFPGGDPWKCVTCGVPPENSAGRTEALDYPQPFPDGRRVLAGTNVIDCGPRGLVACTPERTRIHPIRWNTSPDGSGPGGAMRELRIHPDGVHIGFNNFTAVNGDLDQFAYLGRLKFDPSPETGTPHTPRYDVVNVTRLFDPDPRKQPVRVDPDDPGKLEIDTGALSVGELRGFSKDGREVTYVGYPAESSNIDVFAADLTTGKVRRLTSNPEYTDPVDLSPDGRWTVAMDTRASGRQMFMAGMRGVPPLTDLVSTSATSSTRNNGQRRFFQPILIDRYGDRGSYQGQLINAAGDGGPGSINDPNWNGRADPAWSPDGTSVMYYQRLVTAPACGGHNPLPCPESTAPGGRTYRVMIARLTDRDPVRPRRVAPISDTVPWGTPYEPGDPSPTRPHPRAGTYTVDGAASGTATVKITANAAGAAETVEVAYTNYSDDGHHVLNGTEKVTGTSSGLTTTKVDWHSDLTQTGCADATKKTSPGGFVLTIDVLKNIFQATGTLTTTIDGRAHTQPANGT
ncbi:hypothetical protein AB0L25_24135 [Spirillospora sp. NPDC052242]